MAVEKTLRLESAVDREVRVGIVGASGYTGSELIKLLDAHPCARLQHVMARQRVGEPIGHLFPALSDSSVLIEPWTEDCLSDLDVLFFATPHGVAAQSSRSAVEKGVRVIDLSADFRLSNLAQYERWYGVPHADPELLAQSVYGLPELFRDQMVDKWVIGNPGCYPTSIQLALAPLISSGLLTDTEILVDAKSGVSGAGRKAEIHLLGTEVIGDFSAYGTQGHRHQPEITQGVNRLAAAVTGKPDTYNVTFVPHLLPIVRGIESSIYVKVRDESLDSLLEGFEQFYAEEPFVRVLPRGQMPHIKSVTGTNQCHIGLGRTPDSPFLIVSSVIDNLVKGAAGQAVQNMNIVFGLPETMGLLLSPSYP